MAQSYQTEVRGLSVHGFKLTNKKDYPNTGPPEKIYDSSPFLQFQGHKKSSDPAIHPFYTTASADLKKELPEVKSFSATKLKYMQYFYDLYSSPQVVDLNEDECSPQLVDSINEIYKIPCGHHRYIIDKCRNDRDLSVFVLIS